MKLWPFKKSITRAEKRTLAIAKAMINRKRYSRFLRVLGPGLVTGAADDDPSGIATYSQAGAAYGSGLLWTFPLLLAVQESCARIGAITGKGLAANLKEHYSRPVLYTAVVLVLVANVLNIGADLGAMAATMQLFVDVPYELLAVGFAFGIVALEVGVPYRLYAKILKWLAITLLAYPVTAFLIGQDWGAVMIATFTIPKQIDMSTMYIIVGMLGTTISPYLFFWDTSEVVGEEVTKHTLARIGRDEVPTHNFLHKLRIDNLTGMGLASLTAWFIVIVCGSVLFSHGITSINSAAEYRKSLETKLERLSRMDDMLYDDKLAGDIIKERYETKHKSILEQIQATKDDLAIADSTSAQRHEEAIDLIKLTQTAKDEYLDSDIPSEAKRSILTELFESVTLKDNSVSVKYTFFAESVAKRSSKTKEIMEEQNMLNRTDKDDENNRGETNKKDLKNEIYPVWQGLQDDYRTYCGVISFSEESQGDA